METYHRPGSHSPLLLCHPFLSCCRVLFLPSIGTFSFILTLGSTAVQRKGTANYNTRWRKITITPDGDPTLERYLWVLWVRLEKGQNLCILTRCKMKWVRKNGCGGFETNRCTHKDTLVSTLCQMHEDRIQTNIHTDAFGIKPPPEQGPFTQLTNKPLKPWKNSKETRNLSTSVLCVAPFQSHL